MNQSIIKISLITKKILHELLVWVYPKYCINNKCNYKNKNTKIKCPDLVKVTNYIGQVNCVFATKSKFIIPISLQPDGVNIDFLISEAKKKYLNQGLRLWIEKRNISIKIYDFGDWKKKYLNQDLRLWIEKRNISIKIYDFGLKKEISQSRSTTLDWKKKYLNQDLRLWIEKSFYKIKVCGTDSIPLFSIIKNNSNKSKFIAKNVDGSTKLNLYRRVQLAICSTAFPQVVLFSRWIILCWTL